MIDELKHRPKSEGLKLQARSYLENLANTADEHGITPFNFADLVSKKIDDVNDRLTDKAKSQGILPVIRNDESPEVRIAGAFFREMVTPLIAKGQDAYKPTDDEVVDFCNRLTTDGVNIVLYYAANKTKSPTRTGSPDTLVDLAELELLKNYSVMSHVASHFGMSLRFTIVDESDVIPNDDILGFTQEQKELNTEIVGQMITALDAQDRIVMRPLIGSVSKALGEETFHAVYTQEIENSKTKVMRELGNGGSNALTIRIFTFLDCTPNEGFASMGLSDSNIDSVREITRTRDGSMLQLLPMDVLNYVVGLTAHVDTVMGMRPLATQAVKENGLDLEFPEFSDERVYGGVTRSVSRWSFLPHPVRFSGRTINPMHGLAVYNGGNFMGVAPFSELASNEKFKIIYFGEKPVGAVQL